MDVVYGYNTFYFYIRIGTWTTSLEEGPISVFLELLTKPNELFRSATRWRTVDAYATDSISTWLSSSDGHTPDTQATHTPTDIRGRTTLTRPSSLVIPAQRILSRPGLTHGWDMRKSHTLR